MFCNIKTQLLFDFAVQTFSPEISRISRQRSKSSTALRRRRWRSLYSYGQYIHYFCGYSTEKHYLCSTIKRIYVYIEFDKDYLRELFEQGRTSDKKHRYQPEVIRGYYKCVMFLKRAENVEQLYRIHSLNYEVLQGDKKGVSSVRINIKYRLEFTVREVLGEQVITVCRLLDISNHYK